MCCTPFGRLAKKLARKEAIMASDLKDRLKKAVTEAAKGDVQEPPRTHRKFLRRLALKPVIIIALLVLASVTYAGYRYYFVPFGKITAPAEGALTDRVPELEGYTKNLPADRQYVYLAVDVPKLSLCWPKCRIYSVNDAFKKKIHERGPSSDYTVSLYAVPRNIHKDIEEWIKNCQQTKTETGFKMISDRFRLDSIDLKLREI